MCGNSIIVSVDPHSAFMSLYCYWSFSHQFNINDTIRAVNTGIVYCKRTQEEFGFHVASGKTGDWKSAPFVVFYNKEIIRNKKGDSEDMLEFIAILSMIIDHIGFLWGILVFRIIGRLAMPIFIFNLAKGTLLTKNYPKYLFRLWLFGLLSEYPFLAIINTSFNVSDFKIFELNIVLLMAALASITYFILFISEKIKDEEKGGRLKDVLYITTVIIAFICHIKGWNIFEYQFIGTLLFFVFRMAFEAQILGIDTDFYLKLDGDYTKKHKENSVYKMRVITVFFALYFVIFRLFIPEWNIQIFSIFGVVLLFLVSMKRIRFKKNFLNYWLYLIYPLQFLVLLTIYLFTKG